MAAVNLSTAADQGPTQWDIGLSKTTAVVVRARRSLYDDGPLCNFLLALRDLRRYITRSASRRAASLTLESTLATVLGPLLQEFYAQENSYDVLEELLDIIGTHTLSLLPSASLYAVWITGKLMEYPTAVLVGQGVDDIIAMMGEQGLFHVLVTMLMYAPTTEVTSACLGKLAGTSDSAARQAQVPQFITLATLSQLCKLLSHYFMQAHVGVRVIKLSQNRLPQAAVFSYGFSAHASSAIIVVH